MSAPVVIFLDFNLPNATTWFYFAFLLAMALFFKFSRMLSIRNWDVVTLFLLVPGLLMLQQVRHLEVRPSELSHADVGEIVLRGGDLAAAPLAGPAGAATLVTP